jgi:hypothetical protein
MKNFSLEIQELINIIYRGTGERKAAFTKLMSLNSVDSTAALLRLADDYFVPPFYVGILHELGQRGVLNPMDRFYEILQTKSDATTHTGNQLTVIETLAQYGDHHATIPLLADTLRHHENPYILRQCVYTLGQIGTDDVVYILSLLLQQHPDGRVRHDAVMVLGSTRNPNSVRVLLNYLEQEHELNMDQRPPADCVNAMNSLLRLWKANVKPFNFTRWINILRYWLYQDKHEYPNALYTLNKLVDTEADMIVQNWQQSRMDEADDGFFI